MSCFQSAGAAIAPASGRRLARLLCLGSSLVSVASLACVGQALADTTVGGGRNTPIATATANNGQADNVIIGSGGSVGVPSGTAVTLNSNNNVTNNGSITIQNSDNSTGILAIGGFSNGTTTGSIVNAGSITLNETDTTTTTDSQGNLIGPFANHSNLIGIHVVGPGTLNGSITNTGTITIQGNNSAAILVETPMSGGIVDSGTITVSGTNSVGLKTSTGATLGGGVAVGGGITANGIGASAISIGDTVNGSLQIESAIAATGYHNTVRDTNSTAVLDDQNKNDAGQGGPAVVVGGNLTKGLLVSAPPKTLSSTVTDVNGDGIADAAEPAGSVTSYGSAPAIQVGVAGKNIALGDVGVGQSAFGVTILGTVAGSGVRDGVDANGIWIGDPKGGTVTTGDGMTVDGTVTSTAYSGNSTALHINGGATVPTFYNSGIVEATTTIGDSSAKQAAAVLIESGATVNTIKNAGSIEAITVGQTGTASAIVDKSGSLSRVENVGLISATVYPASGSTAVLNVPTVAIDASQNSTGFTLISYQAYSAAPAIVGNVLMGSGNDSVSILAGTLDGDLQFAGGANTLDIENGAIVVGNVTATGGTLALTIGKGTLQINSTDRINMPSLTLGSQANLTVTADPANHIATELNVAGAANIASGAKIGVRVVSFGGGIFPIIQATQLNAAGISGSVLGAVPYLFNASITSNTATGTVNLNLTQKTAQQLGLSPETGAALDTVLAGANKDATLTQALLAQTTGSGFGRAYNALLPQYNGAIFRLFSTGQESFGRVLDDRQNGSGGGAWVQEINFGLSQSDRGVTPGYTAWGVGLLGGYEFPTTRLGIFGLDLGGYTSQERDRYSGPNANLISNVLQGGAYWRASLGPFTANANVAGDYLMVTNHREVTIPGTGSNLYDATANSNWNGYGFNARFRVAYEKRLGDSFYLRPQVGVDYANLHEDAYTESGAPTLNLAVNSRDSSELSAFAGLALGAQFGDASSSWGPELLLGYRDGLDENLGATTAKFLTTGTPFTVGAANNFGSGPVARLAIKSESTWGAVVVEGGVEDLDHLTAYDIRIAAHFTF